MQPPTNVELTWPVIPDGLLSLVSFHVHLGSPRNHALGSPWFGREVHSLMKKHDHAWRVFVKERRLTSPAEPFEMRTLSRNWLQAGDSKDHRQVSR